jgi:poly-gamma-glutamate capsule biosynthesis protein CapA/YwtB (metallophosphatase superfamily)
VATIVVTGDLMLTRPPGGEALRWLREADLAFVNLEVPLCAGGRPADKLVNLRAGPELAGPLREAGADVVTVANNHALDFGPEGLRQTLEALRATGIRVVGGGENIDAAFAPGIVDVGDTRVACLGMSASLPPGFAAGPTWPGIAPVRATVSFVLDAPTLEEQPGCSPYVATALVEEDARRAEAAVRVACEQADVVIVAIHWGIPIGWVAAFQGPLADYQRPLGHRLIEAGADLVAGHHPHTVHGVERHGRGVICYSLGNFLFHSLGAGGELVVARPAAPPYDLSSLRSSEAREGVVLVAEVAGGTLRGVRLRPLVLDDGGEPHPAGPRANPTLERIAAQSRRLDTELAVEDGELALLME